MPVTTAIGWLLFSFLLALAAARLMIVYARRHGMLDQPGQRRSHRIPTPRGGGIGIVLAAVIFVPGVFATMPVSMAAMAVALVVAGLLTALLLVAVVGWWDDRHSLPALPRFAAQLLAVMLFAAALSAGGMAWAWWLLLVPAGVWSINLHNFMDGIDGLLAQQAVFVGVGLSLLAWAAGQEALALTCLCLAAACGGFWCLNRSPARIFMGDAGSGSVGLLIFAFSALLWRIDTDLVWPALILSSAFVADASLTLLSRFLRGRRWYAAHREHLYQWLVRSGLGHARAGAAYMAWNVLIAAPFAWLAWGHLRLAWLITMAAYVLAGAAWVWFRRRCLRRGLPRRQHVVA